ncbi:MAG: M42 family metallopeptidase [Acidobacteria bacterium]|nr:M42 family metallopeptidase [Acidobacteriota bacterium]
MGRFVLSVCLATVAVTWSLDTRGQTVLQAQRQNPDRVLTLLKELVDAPGPSGFEDPVRAILVREFQATGLQTSTDGLGSVIGVLPGPPGSPRIMLAAHMDELGAMVRYVTAEGMVKFQLLGGWLDQGLVDQRWTIVTSKGPVTAISGQRSSHITPAEERSRVTARDDVFLDVGARSRAEAEALGIQAGDPIVPVSEFAEVANGRYVGKALDDRVGCVMLLETLRRIKEQNIKLPGTIYFVGTVQEELGTRGAHTAVEHVKPELGLSLEAGIAADHPGGRPELTQERLGGGPVLYLADAQMLVNRKLRDLFKRVAADSGIPVQTEVTSGGYEDSVELQRFGGGTPSLNFAVATRYLHGHNSMIERKDLDQAITLLMGVLSKLDRNAVTQIASFQ